MKKIISSLALSSALFAGVISVDEPWAKATPAGAKNSAIFMQIKNSSDADVKLINAHSNIAATTELHTHVHENGMMKMIRVNDINIPAHGAAILKPKDLHVMLFDVKEPITTSSDVDVELEFSNGEKITLNKIPVKAVKMQHNHEHAHEHKH